jgi:hypothetical protein
MFWSRMQRPEVSARVRRIKRRTGAGSHFGASKGRKGFATDGGARVPGYMPMGLSVAFRVP